MGGYLIQLCKSGVMSYPVFGNLFWLDSEFHAKCCFVMFNSTVRYYYK